MTKDKRKQPRWLQHIKATLGGYFWQPCPLCGECFGGHEWSGDSDLATSYGEGIGVCDNCTAKANRINKKNNWFIPKTRSY